MKDKTEMILYKNGYIVVTVNSYFPFSYEAWPLSRVEDDTANQLTEEADDRWFTVYAMKLPRILIMSGVIRIAAGKWE